MRIALVHSFYRSEFSSGENEVVRAQQRLLETAGHQVALVGVETDELSERPFYGPRTAANLLRGRGWDPTPELREFGPDVVHVHNLFPNIATDWLSDWQGPLVATLHNYRMLCANGLLFRAGRDCTLCPDGHRWAGVRHGCYHDSSLATVPVALRTSHGLARQPLLARADRVILLSARSLRTFSDYGLDTGRAALLPNGVAASVAPVPPTTASFLTLGRISPEKGLLELAGSWPPGHRLDVYGSGPLSERLAVQAPSAWTLKGHVPDVAAELARHVGAVFNGRNREGAYPLAVVEAMAAGLPVIARAGGAAADLVEQYDCGVTYASERELLEALDEVAANPRGPYSQAGRDAWRRDFRPEAWLTGLEALYEALL